MNSLFKLLKINYINNFGLNAVINKKIAKEDKSKSIKSFGMMLVIAISVIIMATVYAEIIGEALAQIISELNGTDICIVSGLASGIDTTAHVSALDNNLKTVGVIASGFDYTYPAANKELYKRIENGCGAVLSEYYPTFEPLKFRFPQRNRIVSGLSYGTLVAEASLKSGALITANLTLEQGRELMCIPGLITKYHKHVVETKLQRFDSIMNQAVRMAIAENGEIIYEPPANEATNAEYLKEWFNDNLMKYLKANYEGEVIGKKYYKVSFLDGTGFVSYIPNDGGTIYFFFCSDVRDKSCHVESFDGQHTFLFDYAKDKEAVLPHGYTINDVEKLKYLDNGTTGCYVKTNPNHHLCTQLIKLNGWKIPSDYPWIK